MKDAKLITTESHIVPRARAPPIIEAQIIAFFGLQDKETSGLEQ